MTNEEIIKYQKKAKYVATKCGYRELADDFAQELLLEFIENPDRGATVDQLFVDYLRRTYGRTGSPGGDARSRAIHTAISIDEVGEGESKNALHDYIAAPQPDTESERAVRECSHLFSGREAEIYQAYFVDERTEKDIGQSMNLTECRISQLLKPMKKEIEDHYILRECLERMEWDQDFTKLKVDWIKL